MEKLTIFGKNVPPEEKKNVEDFIISERAKAKEPVDGEYEKIEDDYKVIEMINKYIQEELKELGVENGQKLSSDQIHLFPALTYGQKFPEAGTSAFYSSIDNAVCVNADVADTDGRLQLYRDMLHEIIHMTSVSKFYLDQGTVKVYRSGYRSLNPPLNHEHFNGLNEALVEKTVIDILSKHRQEIIKQFNLTEEEIQKESEYFCGYHKYIEILDVIVNKIGQVKRENSDEVWKRLKKGLFTGEMMHLREIEKIWGKKSLRVLDILETDRMGDEPMEAIEKIKRYFETEDEIERQNLLTELLPDENEREKRSGYQSIEDIELSEVQAGDEDAMNVFVDNLDSQSEAEREVRKRLEDTNWWLQKYWTDKGLPKEQLSINHGTGQLEVYNFGVKLDDALAEEVERAMEMLSRLSNGKYIEKVKFILIDDLSQKNPNSGDAKWGERNKVTSSINLTPDAISSKSHRVESASVFLGTILHEAGHFVADDLRGDWIKKFGWEELDTPEPLPGGGMKYYRCLDESRCVNEYAAYSPDEDIAESLVTLSVQPEKLDKDKRQYLEQALLDTSDKEPENKVEIIRRQDNDITLPEVSSPVKYRKEKKKKFNISG